MSSAPQTDAPPPAGASALFGAAGAALSAAIIGFGGTITIVVEAGHALGASEGQITSWVTAICIGVAVTTLVLSLWFRIPIVTAWSTPGAALIVGAAAGMPFPVAITAFVMAGLMAVAVSLIPPLERAVARIPQPIAAGMLAGVLLPFGLGLFSAAARDAVGVGLLLVVYFLARRFAPLAALLLVLAVAAALLAFRGQLPPFVFSAPHLELTQPDFDLMRALGLAVPLFIVTMVAQNLPGFAVLQASGYTPPTRASIGVTGLATLILAPVGVHGINLAAITAALCTSPDAYPDPKKRYLVGWFYAGAYAVLAVLAAPLVGIFAGVPRPALAIVAGLALFGPLASALTQAFSGPPESREAVLVTILATASGVAFLGLAASFWGLVLGILVLSMRRIGWPGRRRHK